MRRLLATLLAASTLAGTAHATPPPLYAYRGAGSTGVAALKLTENFLGRKVDGVADFNDYTQTPTNAVSNLNWALGYWQGDKRTNISIGIGLAFSGMTTAQITTGAMDAQFTAMSKSLASHGFTRVYVRLGWEMNGGWYGWGQKGATYVSAFNHVAPILKANCPQCLIVWNPAAGITNSGDYPGDLNVDLVAGDDYINSWNSGGPTTEPGLFGTTTTGDYGGYYGFISYLLGSSRDSHPTKPTAVPEFGVGSRSDGHGACTTSSSTAGYKAACDDAYGMAQSLKAFTAAGVQYIVLWDYDAGDYNSQVSSDERPGEALEVLKVYGGGDLATVLAGASLYTGTAFAPTPPAGDYQILAQLANGDVEQLTWSATQSIAETDLTAQAAAAAAQWPKVDSAYKVSFSDSAFECGVMDNADGSKTVTYWRSKAYSATSTEALHVYLPAATSYVMGGKTQKTVGNTIYTNYPAGTSDVVVTIPAS